MSELIKNTKTELIYEFLNEESLTVTRYTKDNGYDDTEVWYNINGSDLDWEEMASLVHALVTLVED